MNNVERHNRVVAAGVARALALEPKLTKILIPILNEAGTKAAAAFEAKTISFLNAAALQRVDDVLLASLPTSVAKTLLSSLALTGSTDVGPTSTMIAVKPRPEEAAQMAQEGGHAPGDLHVTLAYLGGYEGSLATLAEILAPVAGAHAPLEGKVAGVGSFDDNGKGAPAILLPSVPGLIELRLAVTEALLDGDHDYSRAHGYQPHATVAYDAAGEPPSREAIGTPLHFDELLIVRGNAESVALPLTGPPPLTAAGEAGEAGTSEEQRAMSEVDAAARELAEATHEGDTARVALARKRLVAAQDALERALATEATVRERKQQQDAQDQKRQQAQDEAKRLAKEQAKKDKNIPPEVQDTASKIETPQSGAPSPQDVAREIAKSTSEEQRIESESASEVERVTVGKVGDIAKRIQQALTSPFGGAADWTSPVADELVGVAELAKQLRQQTEPARQAVIENVMKTGVEGAGIKFDIANPFAAKVLAQSGSQITNIAETTQLNVMRIIKEAHDNGLSIPDTAALIRTGMTEATPARAALIARTELAGAVNGGSLAATQIVQSATDETYYKQWLTAPGAPHPRHEDYDGLDEQTQTLDDYFDVGGSALQYPGDPDGDIGETANCRCALVYLTPEDAAAQGIQLGGTSAPSDKSATPEEAQLGLAALAKPMMDDAGPITTADPAVAAQAIADGQKVVLNQPTQIATLIDALGAMAKTAQDQGLAAPRLNLGLVSVPGTNLFTQESIGAPRVEMPQLKGVPAPGSLADAMPRDARGEVDIAPLFYKRLQDEGVQIEHNQSVRVDHLRATQTELDGAKVAGIMDYLEGGGKIEGSIPVTKDGYVIDGHHRWAAEIGLDYKSGADKPWMIQADVINKDIVSVINEANQIAAEYGIPQATAFKVDAAKAETQIGITPFRPEDTVANFYDTAKAQQFEAELEPVAKEYGVTISSRERSDGIWQGEPEPSYVLKAHDGPDGVSQFAATMRAKYNQDGVALFTPNPIGQGYAYTLHRVDPAEVLPRVADFGIDGATGVGDTVQIFGDQALAANVDRLATEFKSVVTVQRGELSFVERGQVPRSLDEVKALHPGVEIQATEDEEGISLSLLRVPADVQGKGEASAAMNDLLRYADGRGLIVALTPEAVGSGMSASQLKAWYKRLGFVPNKGRGADLRFSESMIRPPASVTRPLFDQEAVPAAAKSYFNAIQKAINENMKVVMTLRAKGGDDFAAAAARQLNLLLLRDHPNPEAELSFIRQEAEGLQEKVDDGTASAAERADLAKLREQANALTDLSESPVYAEFDAKRRAALKEAEAIQAKTEDKAAKLTAADTASTAAVRDALKAQADDATIPMPARTIPWSVNGNYEAGPSVAWRHKDVVFTAEIKPGVSAEATALGYQKQVEPWVEGLPDQIRSRLDRVNIYLRNDPDEKYWAEQFHQTGNVLAATGNGSINFFGAGTGLGAKSLARPTLEHESGHLIFPNGGPKDENAWIDAANSDSNFARSLYKLSEDEILEGTTPGSFRGFLVGVRGVTDYGTSALPEDWAESIRLFLRDRREGSIGTLSLIPKTGEDYVGHTRAAAGDRKVRFADIYPARAKLIEEWLDIPPESGRRG